VGGANINPAVSVALFITGESNVIRVIFYILCQMSGAVLASLTLVSLAPAHITTELVTVADNITGNLTTFERTRSLSELNLGLTLVSDEITPAQGFGVECIITFILIFCVFACIDNERSDLTGSFPLSIGLAVVIGGLFGVRNINLFNVFTRY
jgi:glycerol uptake facilitator-like aquaporin